MLFLLYLALLSILTGVAVNYNRRWPILGKAREEASEFDAEAAQLFSAPASVSPSDIRADMAKIRDDLQRLSQTVNDMGKHAVSPTHLQLLQKLAAQGEAHKERLLGVEDNVRGMGAKIIVEMNKKYKQMAEEVLGQLEGFDEEIRYDTR